MKVQLFASVSAMLLCTIPGVVLSTEEQPNLRGVTLATAFEDQLADLMTGDKDIKKEVKKVVDKKGGNAKKVIKKLEDKGYDKKEVKKLVNKAVKKYEEKRDYYRKDRKSCSEHYKEEDCRGYRGCGGYRCCAWEAGKCHTIRSFEDEDFSLDSSEVLFDSEEYDMDLYEDEDSEDYDFYENKEESFTTTTLRIPPPPAKKYCFQWHNDESCRIGGRTDAGRCARNWTKKCIYCEMDREEANHLTGECVPRLGFGGSDVRVKQCFRWHKDVGCRRGSEASHCRRNWTKKCIYCERDVKANKITGKCKRNGKLMEEA